MRSFEILTLFPEFFDGPLRVSILKRAQEKGLLSVRVRDLRDYGEGVHRKCDDKPYGGGAGMVMQPGPLFAAIRDAKRAAGKGAKVVVFSAKGRKTDQALLRELSVHPKFVLVAGHYEGMDQRVIGHCADWELSTGDYVLTGGEIPCLAFVDAMSRLTPGVLKNDESAGEESFDEQGLLEYDQYTRPETFRGWKVPDVLLSGDHVKVRQWRQESRLANTKANRPDLLKTKGD
jgi:tRNA (guanine37-N1)-methyltransferase